VVYIERKSLEVQRKDRAQYEFSAAIATIAATGIDEGARDLEPEVLYVDVSLRAREP
jgi:hypothetical protein